MVNPRKILCLTGFLNRIFTGENAKNRDFYGEEKCKSASLYHFAINHAPGILERYAILTATFASLSGGRWENA
jgi:hypothetical protein